MQAAEELYQDFCICSLILGHDAENHGKPSIWEFGPFCQLSREHLGTISSKEHTLLRVQIFHYTCYTCYSYFVELIIYLVINAKRGRGRRKKNGEIWCFFPKPQNYLKTLLFINKSYHSKISICTEQIMLSLANLSYLFLITSRIVWFQTTHHMAHTANEILDIFLKDLASWAEFFILFAYRDAFYSLFSILSIHMSSIWSTAAVTWLSEHRRFS